MKHNAATNQIVVFVKVDETFTTIWLSRSSKVRVKVRRWLQSPLGTIFLVLLEHRHTQSHRCHWYLLQCTGYINQLILWPSVYVGCVWCNQYLRRSWSPRQTVLSLCSWDVGRRRHLLHCCWCLPRPWAPATFQFLRSYLSGKYS